MEKFRYAKLGDAHWYHVVDAKTGKNEYALFSLINAPANNPCWVKHMELHFCESAAMEILELGKMSLLHDIYYFVFNAVLEISHQLRGVKLCKIYSTDEITRLAYRKFADNLGEKYAVKFYGHWIEIRKNLQK